MTETTTADAAQTWSPRARLLTVLFVLAIWAVGLMTLAGNESIGWLPTLIAAWMTAGLIYTGWVNPGTMRR